METPICDFVRKYAGSGTIRAHMPGHKGNEVPRVGGFSGARMGSGKEAERNIGKEDERKIGREAEGEFERETGGEAERGFGKETEETYNSAFAKIAKYDITEIARADDLYDPHGIIAESEANATRVFGCPTFYSTEGSSLCIRAMLYLCMMKQREEAAKKAAGTRRGAGAGSAHESWMAAGKKSRAGTEAARVPWVLAGRDAHKTFLSACILLGLDVEWVAPETGDEVIDGADVEKALLAGVSVHGCLPCCVYVTTPTYTGCNVSIGEIARICHQHGVPVAADNAHGAYMHFYGHYQFGAGSKDALDPISRGADICCDSAHKTLPVLTGGAYLHLREGFLCGNSEPGRVEKSERTEDPAWAEEPWRTEEPGRVEKPEELGRKVKEAMAMFASTSPSWLILQSLDRQNPYLASAFGKEVGNTAESVMKVKKALREAGFVLVGDDFLRITIATRGWGYTGDEFAEILRAPHLSEAEARGLTDVDAPHLSNANSPELSDAEARGDGECEKETAIHAARPVEVEFSDPDVVVMMFSPANASSELEEILDRILRIPKRAPLPPSPELRPSVLPLPEKVMTVRETALLPGEIVPVGEALGRVAQLMDVSCPPAIPIVMPGERIGEREIARLRYYGYETCKVVRE